MAILNILVTRSTKNQRFAASGCHDFDPGRFFSARIAVQVFECPNMVGSGAVVPCGDRPSPALRTVRAAFHPTRLALYALLERLFVREDACMKLVMAVTTKDQCFPVAGPPHALPERLSFFHIFQFSYIIHLKWPFPRLTIIPSPLFVPLDVFVKAHAPKHFS